MLRSAPGTGTTVSLYLPELAARTREERRASPPPPLPSESLEPGPRTRLLVVDNDTTVLPFPARMLASMGFQVTPASSGRAGITAIESAEFDLVVTDVVMPDLDGVAVARSAAAREVPVLFVSGCAPDELARRGMTGAA